MRAAGRGCSYRLMVINCVKCGRPVCAVTLPELNKGEQLALRGLLGGLGVDLGAYLPLILNPTPEAVAAAARVACPDTCP